MSNRVDHRWWESRFKFANGAYATDAIVSDPSIDRTAMSARFTISTATPDRVGELLIPVGCDLTNYRKNPVVYYGHALEGIVLPIGTSNDPDGNLSVQITDDEVTATCFFSQSSLEANQIFQLVDEGILKAASVRETPLSNPRRGIVNGRQVDIIDRYTVEEWSICGIGVNPDAVRKALSSNRLAGKPIAESIFKSLNACAAPVKRYGVGFKEQSVKEPNDLDDDGENKLADVESTKSDNTGKKTPAETPADEVDEDDDGKVAPEAESADPEQDQLYGRQLIGAAHEGLKSLRASLRRGMKSLDNAQLKPDVQAHHDRLGEELPVLKGMCSAHYAGSSELKDEDMGDDSGGDEGGDEGGDSAMKSLLSSVKTSKFKALSIKADLRSVLKSARLGSEDRAKILRGIDTLDRLLTESEAYKPTLKSMNAVTTTTVAETPKADPVAAEALKKLINS